MKNADATRYIKEYIPAIYNNVGGVATFDKEPDNYFKTIQNILDTQRERLEVLERESSEEVLLYEIKDITPEEIEAAQYINKVHNEGANAIEEYTIIGNGNPVLTRAMYYFGFRCRGYCFETDLIKIEPENDPVNSPAHYTYGKIEVIDYILDKKLDFCLGNVIKYVSRAGHKNNALEDLQKAAKYLEFKINELKTKESE